MMSQSQTVGDEKSVACRVRDKGYNFCCDKIIRNGKFVCGGKPRNVQRRFYVL